MSRLDAWTCSHIDLIIADYQYVAPDAHAHTQLGHPPQPASHDRRRGHRRPDRLDHRAPTTALSRRIDPRALDHLQQDVQTLRGHARQHERGSEQHARPRMDRTRVETVADQMAGQKSCVLVVVESKAELQKSLAFYGRRSRPSACATRSIASISPSIPCSTTHGTKAKGCCRWKRSHQCPWRLPSA